VKNIAIFTDNLKVGGIQKSIVNLLNNIDYTKYNVDLYLFDKTNFYDVKKNVNVIYLDRPNSFFKFIPFKIVKKIMKIKVSNKKYDIAIDFDSYQMHTAIGALRCNAKKRAIWVHNDIKIKLQEEFKYKILHFFFKDKYKYFDTYVSVSQGALDSFKIIHNVDDKKNYLVIPNYINTEEIYDKLKENCDLIVDKNKINIVSVGRLCHQKGYDIMLQEMSLLLKSRDDFHLYLIGDGPDKLKLEKQVSKLNLVDYVTFLGNQKNPFKFLKKMDLFYMSSRYEGQGMAILEAKSVGLDTLIPKHLEKYCPLVKGTDDVIKFLTEYNNSSEQSFDDLHAYNDSITKSLEKLFN